jgi:hypothetical protein
MTIFFIPKCSGPHVEYVARSWQSTKLRYQLDPGIFLRKYSGRHVENVSEVGITHRYIYTRDGIFCGGSYCICQVGRFNQQAPTSTMPTSETSAAVIADDPAAPTTSKHACRRVSLTLTNKGTSKLKTLPAEKPHTALLLLKEIFSRVSVGSRPRTITAVTPVLNPCFGACGEAGNFFNPVKNLLLLGVEGCRRCYLFCNPVKNSFLLGDLPPQQSPLPGTSKLTRLEMFLLEELYTVNYN